MCQKVCTGIVGTAFGNCLRPAMQLAKPGEVVIRTRCLWYPTHAAYGHGCRQLGQDNP